MKDDFEQSIKSTQHDLDLAKINLFLNKQRAHERMALFHEDVKELMTIIKTRGLDPARREIFQDTIRDRELTIAVLEGHFKDLIVQAQECVDVLVRQLGELKRGVAPTF